MFLTATIQTTVSDGIRKVFVLGDDVLIYENNTLQEEKSAVATVSIAGFNLKMTKVNVEEEGLLSDLIDVTQAEEEYTRQVLIAETNLQGGGTLNSFTRSTRNTHVSY